MTGSSLRDCPRATAHPRAGRPRSARILRNEGGGIPWVLLRSRSWSGTGAMRGWASSFAEEPSPIDGLTPHEFRRIQIEDLRGAGASCFRLG